MKRITPVLLALTLAACSREAEPDPQVEASAAPVQTPVPEATVPAQDAAAARLVSRYTSLKDCKVVEAPQDEDWSISRCPGPNGYGLKLNYGDAREDLELLKDGKSLAELNLSLAAGGGFNAVGDTVEWRGTGEGSAFVPAALIVRNHAIRDSEHPDRQTALLMVYDIGQRCIVAIIEPGAGQNEAARAAADGPRRACLNRGTN